MKRLISLIFFMICFAVAGCGGIAVIDAELDESSPDGQGGSSSTIAVVSSTSGSGGEGEGGGAVCQPLLLVEYAHADMVAAPGDQDVSVILGELTANECGDIEIFEIAFALTTPDAETEDSTPFCSAPCSDQVNWNFRDLKITNATTDATLMGPAAFHQGASNQPARVDFIDAFTLEAGESVGFSFTMDIANPLATPIQGKRFAAFLLGVDTGPGVVLEVASDFGSQKYISIR